MARASCGQKHELFLDVDNGLFTHLELVATRVLNETFAIVAVVTVSAEKCRDRERQPGQSVRDFTFGYGRLSSCMMPPFAWSSLSLRQVSSARTAERLARVSRRHKSSLSIPKADLPPLDEWRTYFPNQFAAKERVSVRNPATADSLAKSYFHPKSIAAGKGKIIIEAFPGPGQLSRALLRLPSSHISKLIILEDHPAYLEYLRPLEQMDPRVTVISKSGFEWDTYAILEETGVLDDVETASWDNIHPQLHFISHISHNVKGEQLVAQLFRCIPAKSWLFKYGRVPMSLILSQSMWDRVIAPAGAMARCKVGVIAEASAALQNSVRPTSLLPYDNHFHPALAGAARSRTGYNKSDAKKVGQPMISVNVVPFAEQIITPQSLDAWDYVLRRMFVMKSTPVSKALGYLAAGASSLLTPLTSEDLPPDERVDVKRRIKDLTLADWTLVLRAFENWPFAPSQEDMAIASSFNMHEARAR
ncbi:Mitochondrial transcription factor 1 [Steccherinum ochraceum]|uniref:rRNA adenine N(6)-methyltransferase n=1 Tax=Steccherinum ochraceum TaxID=92696 RepID=A0A4R0RGC3_9APHY|nr:Mitochondrial transcription factor 1 [Steccherinum ochraceum]